LRKKRQAGGRAGRSDKVTLTADLAG